MYLLHCLDVLNRMTQWSRFWIARARACTFTQYSSCFTIINTYKFVLFSTGKFVTYIIDNLRSSLKLDYRNISSRTRSFRTSKHNSNNDIIHRCRHTVREISLIFSGKRMHEITRSCAKEKARDKKFGKKRKVDDRHVRAHKRAWSPTPTISVVLWRGTPTRRQTRKPTSRVNDSPRERWRDRPARFASCPFSWPAVLPYFRENVASAPACLEYFVRIDRWSFDRILVYNRFVYVDNFLSFFLDDRRPPASWGWVPHPCQVLDPFVAAIAAVDWLCSTGRLRLGRESRLIELGRYSAGCLRCCY